MQDKTDDQNKESELQKFRDIQEKTEERIDEGAKQLITLNGLLQGLFLAAFAFSDLRELVRGWPVIIFIVALSSLVASLICTALYFFPLRGKMRLNINSIDNIKQALEKIYFTELNWRVNWLRRGQILFLAGLSFSFILMMAISLKSDINNDNTIKVIIITPTPKLNPTPTHSPTSLNIPAVILK